MHCHLIIPQLFPAAATGGDESACPRLPALERLIARGRRSRHASGTLAAWAAGHFGLDPHALPLAPWRAATEGLVPGAMTWVCLDPIHLEVGARDVRIGALRDRPGPDETAALFATLQQQLGDETLWFMAGTAGHGYACGESIRIQAAPPPGAGPIDPAGLPSGPDGAHWRRLLTEAQMVLHDHPVNQARERRGLPAINGLWAWGCGRLEPLASHAREQWSTDDALLAGLASAAGATVMPALANAEAMLARPPAAADAHPVCLIHLPHAEQALEGNLPGTDAWSGALARLERDWFAPLVEAIRGGRIGMLTLHALAGCETLQAELTRGDLRQIWRRPRALTHWLSRAGPDAEP